MPFLKNFAAEIVKNHDRDLKGISVILPTQRSIRFFKEHLVNEVNAPFVFPRLFTLEQFIYRIANQIPTEKVQLLKVLYDVWNNESERPWTLKEFLEVGPKLLGDFDHIENGDNDGIALVCKDVVIEFISYEGVITAADGPAAGLTS